MNYPPTRESVSKDTIPPRPVSEIATEALADLDKVIARLAEFGVHFPEHSRLEQARLILADARDSGKLAPVQRGDTLGLRALETVLDFRDIASTLPPDKDASLRKDLELALGGTLEPTEAARGPLQLQSQLAVRAAFVRGGATLLKAGRPRHGKPVPDLLLENGASTYAIEVKRPQSSKGLVARFSEGVDQVRRYGTSGGILVDVTDCVRGRVGDELDTAVRECALMLYDLAWDGRSYRPGYSHIIVIGVVARPAWSSDDGANAAIINVHSSTTVGVLATHRNNLAGHRARWIRQVFQTGTRLLGKTSAEQE